MHKPQKGVTLIETMIGIVLLGMLVTMAAPSYSTLIRNNQIRTTAEAILNGLQLARMEAVKRNTLVRFQLVSDLTNSCALSASGNSWVVSRDVATGKCASAPSDTTAPGVIQAWSASQGSAATSVSASLTGGTDASVVFDGYGTVSAVTLGSSISQVNVSITGASAGQFRDLRILVSPGGRVFMCDPAVT
ncbi:MAG: pilus assembly protein FimT, partial [Comamonadaceae bacterium CG_4_9_14_3_um_filter_60_33]